MNYATRSAIGVVRFYQAAISPYIGARCRFYPSCSHYTVDALREHGLARGLWLAVCRLAKCHPFHPGGVDYVPPRREGCRNRWKELNPTI